MTKEYSPSEWSAQVDYDSWSDLAVPKDKVVVHYGGNPSFAGDAERAAEKGYGWPTFEVERAALRIYEQGHLSRGWRGLAYGWAIGQSGNVYRARGWNIYGAHRGDLEPDGIPENQEGIPVLFLLGGDQVPTAASLESLEWLTKKLEADSRAFVNPLPMYGHKEIAELGTGTTTGCPGVHLTAYVQARRENPPSPIPEPLPPEDDSMQYFLNIFNLWSRADLVKMAEAGYWTGVENVDWYFNPQCPDEEKVNLVVHILANGNKDVPDNIPGPQGPAGTVEVFVNGDKVA